LKKSGVFIEGRTPSSSVSSQTPPVFDEDLTTKSTKLDQGKSIIIFVFKQTNKQT